VDLYIHSPIRFRDNFIFFYLVQLPKAGTNINLMSIITGNHELLLGMVDNWPVTVAERSKACIVLALSEAGTWVPIPHKARMFGMCMCLFRVCVVLCLGSGLATS
jgi:hypothetical protein